MNCVVYLRVSTKKQDQTNYSIEKQLFKCSEYIFKKKYKIIDVIKDVSSAYNNKNRRLYNLIDNNDYKNIDRIIVYSFDRFSRNKNDGLRIVNKLLKKNIFVESVTEDIDYTSKKGYKQLKKYLFNAQLHSDTLSKKN